MSKTLITRRGALALAAASGALPLFHVSSAHAAGTLRIAFWDHWVPGGTDVMRQQVDTWAKKNKVDVQPDFVTSSGNKLQLTAAAEAQAGTGHDVMTFFTWDVHNHAQRLDPMDDAVKRLTAKYGELNDVCSYLARQGDHWMAVPTSSGTQNKPACGRISLLKKIAGLDLEQMYPAKEVKPPEAANWSYDTFLIAAEACQKANYPFGLGLGTTSDSVDWVGAMFAAYGADLVDRSGKIQVKSDAINNLLEYAAKLVKTLPPDTVSYDDASNNRALISGKSALICNPPSAWAVAKRDAPEVAADCWTFPNPAGPKGRYIPFLAFFWGVWKFSNNKTAGKELIEYLMQREQVEARCNKVDGYDIPPFPSMLNFDIWSQVEPPKGTVYNYPTRPWHQAVPSIAGSSASPDVAVQIYNRGTMTQMLARLRSGSSPKDVMNWASDELEGFLRP
jgi:ABC-type glycerol-3-phosphate transport system substrate-binding protein